MEKLTNTKRGSAVRMQEVASRAGVSIATVSRILADRGAVAPDLQERVMQVIEETGYRKLRRRTSKAAANVATTKENKIRTGNVVFIACERVINQAHEIASRYHEMLSRVHMALKEHNLDVMLVSEDSSEAAALPKSVRDGQVDGAIVASPFDRKFMKKLSDSVPVVMLNSICYSPALPTVILDNNQMMLKAVEHLYELGHRRIGFFTPDMGEEYLQSPEGFQLRRMLEGYRDAVSYFELDKKYLFVEKFGMDGHPQAVKKTMDKMSSMPDAPTAIISSARYASFFAYEAAERNMSVPGDLSLIATDDPVVAGFPAPQLTAFKSNLEVVTAVDLLVKKLKGNAVPNQKILIEPEFIERESTGPVAS